MTVFTLRRRPEVTRYQVVTIPEGIKTYRERFTVLRYSTLQYVAYLR